MAKYLGLAVDDIDPAKWEHGVIQMRSLRADANNDGASVSRVQQVLVQALIVVLKSIS